MTRATHLPRNCLPNLRELDDGTEPGLRAGAGTGRRAHTRQSVALAAAGGGDAMTVEEALRIGVGCRHDIRIYAGRGPG